MIFRSFCTTCKEEKVSDIWYKLYTYTLEGMINDFFCSKKCLVEFIDRIREKNIDVKTNS